MSAAVSTIVGPRGCIEVHPAAELVPAMTEDEYTALRDDIAANGLKQPVVLFHGRDVLDGRHRLRACHETGVEPRYEHYKGDDPIGFVVSMNITRRHLSPGQRAAVAAKTEGLYRDEANQRLRAGQDRGRAVQSGDLVSTQLGGDQPSGRSREGEALAKAAKAAGSSTTSAGRVKFVEREAPDLYERIVAGTLTPHRAEQIAKQRKTVPTPDPVPLDRSPASASLRRRRMRELAASGATAQQIAADIGMTEAAVKSACRQYNIALTADALLGNRRRIDSNRVIESTVTELEATDMAIALVDFEAVDITRCANWATSLDRSLKSLRRLTNKLKEMARDPE